MLRFRRCIARNFSSTKDPQSFRAAAVFCGSQFYCPLPHIYTKYSIINSYYDECNLIAKTRFVIVKIERKMITQGPVFWVQRKGNNGLINIIMLASFPKVPKTYRPKVLKIDVFDYPTVVLRPLSMERLGISAQSLYCQS